MKPKFEGAEPKRKDEVPFREVPEQTFSDRGPRATLRKFASDPSFFVRRLGIDWLNKEIDLVRERQNLRTTGGRGGLSGLPGPSEEKKGELNKELSGAAREIQHAFEELRDIYRIPLDARCIVGKDETGEPGLWMVSRNVGGEELELREFKEPERNRARSILDDLLVSLIRYARDKWAKGELLLWDIFRIEQYRWGRISKNEEERAYLVDVDPYFGHEHSLSNPNHVLRYIGQFVDWSERKTGAEMDRARTELKNLEVHFEKYKPEYAKLLRSILRNRGA